MRTVNQFLSDLYHGCEDGSITITTLPDGKNYHYPVADVNAAAERIQELGKWRNTYYNLALRKPGLDERTRGRDEDIHTVTCMFADIDIRGPAHKQDALPESEGDVKEFLSALSLPASYVINSGNGVHVLWLLEKPFVIQSSEDLSRIKSISQGFGAYIIRSGMQRGWKLDNVQDITRMLRAPDTLNFKSTPPKECQVIHYDPIRYPLSAFETYKAPEKTFTPTFPDDDRIGPAERMCGKCPFIDYCIKEAPFLSEPWWHAFISIVALTENGDEKCHEWSENHGTYSYDETESYRVRAIKEKKPCSCDFIRNGLGFDCPDGGCGVGGPIAFSFYSKEEQLERLLGEEIDLDTALNDDNLRLVSYAKDHAPAMYIRLKKKYQKLGVGVRDLEKSISDTVEKDTTAKEDFFGGINLEGLDTTGLIIPDRWMLSMTGLEHLVVTPSGTYVEKITGTPLLITKKIEDLEDGTVKLEITFFHEHHWKSVIIPRGEAMDKGKLVKHANSGLPVHTGNASTLVSFFAAFEEANDLPFNRSIDHLGWVDGTDEFYPYHMKDEVAFEGDTAEAANLVKAITTAGSEEEWMKMAVRLRTLLCARAMLAASFASVLLHPLQHRNIYLHLWKDSRSGKSAAQKAAISIWGDPERLMINYNSTQVGFERSAAAMNHLPLALDELQSCTMKPDQFSRLVYMLGNGAGRTRGNQYGGTQKLLHWNNVILSTGEQPIITGNAMDGVVTRVMDICGAPIPDETFAASVHRTCANNYGFAGDRFVQWLYETYLSKKDGLQTLRADYDRLTGLIDMLYDLYEGHSAGPHLENVAIIAFADCLSSVALFGVDEDTAENDAINLALELLRNIHSQEKADSIDRAWDYIVDWVISGKMHFEVKRRLGAGFDRAAVSPIYGRYYPEEKQVRIVPSILYEALMSGGFSVEKCYQGFKERGYIETAQVKTRVAGENTKTIIANIELDLRAAYESDEEVFLGK